jgi:hypothetical protein
MTRMHANARECTRMHANARECTRMHANAREGSIAPEQKVNPWGRSWMASWPRELYRPYCAWPD